MTRIHRERAGSGRARRRSPALAALAGLLLLAAAPATGAAEENAAAAAAAEATPGDPAPSEDPTGAAPGAEVPDTTPEQVHNPDPWEPMNRKIFWLNEKGDIYAVAPFARGWRFVTPVVARKAIENFNGLLLMPVIFLNDVLQLKPMNAWEDVARAAFNATFGIAGLIDFATLVDIPQNDADFGQSLGFWGVPPGPYLVLPVFGPSNVRDGVGRLGDAAATLYFSLLPWWATFIVRGVELVNLRARFLEEVDENRRESFDYYVFLRDAYLQNRAARVARARGEEDLGVEEEDADDLYYFDDEEDLDVYDEDQGGAADPPDEGADAR